MCNINKCSNWSHYKNVNGKNIILMVSKHHNTLKIDIKYNTVSSKLKQCMLASFFIIVNLILISIFRLASIYISIALSAVTLYQLYIILYSVQFERLIIAKKLGFQVEVHYNYGSNVKYVAWQQIKSILINEVITKQRVIFMLALLIHDKAKEDDKIIPLFTNVMPRLQCLETIYQQIEIFQE